MSIWCNDIDCYKIMYVSSLASDQILFQQPVETNSNVGEIKNLPLPSAAFHAVIASPKSKLAMGPLPKDT